MPTSTPLLDPCPPAADAEETPAVAAYQHAVRVLLAAEVPFLAAGTYALAHYTDIPCETVDLDLFLRPEDVEEALDRLAEVGFETERPFPHWLAKAHLNGETVDLIYRSGNGLSEVADDWFERAPEARLLGETVRLCPAEEVLWTKAFIMERERYDGADVAHLILRYGTSLDWGRLVRLFMPDPHVLLSHLLLFQYSYPNEPGAVPPWIVPLLLKLIERHPAPEGRVCRGTLLSRAQYLVDIEEWGYEDVRQRPRVHMTAEEIETWTQAIEDRRPH